MFDDEKFFREFFSYPSPAALELWANEYDEMTVHTRGRVPVKLIKERRPYEDEVIQKYRQQAYEPITKDPIDRAINNLQRIFSKSQVNIEVPENIDEYLSENNFSGLTFNGFIRKAIIRRMIEDPNGALCWFPAGKGLEQGNEAVQVKPYVVVSKNILHFDEHVMTWHSHEKSIVLTDKGEVYEGEIYYVITENAYYRYEQFGKKEDKKFRHILIYKHSLNFLPVIVLGGELSGEINDRTNTEILFLTSYFSSFKAFANEAIRQFSDHQGAMTVSGFPIREMDSISCPNNSCKNGWIYDNDRRKSVCPDCDGNGIILPSGSPYGVYLRPPRKGPLQDNNSDPVPAVRFITPPVEILKYMGEHTNSLIDKAEKALNLLFIQEAQSGRAKEIDREDKVATLDKIGENVYMNIVFNSMKIISGLINNNEGDKPIINLPPTFTVKSEQELIDELGTLRKDGAPEFIVSEASMDLLRSRYGSNPKVLFKAKILRAYDTFFTYSTEQKNNLQASGAMTQEEFLKSVHAPTVLAKIALEMGDKFYEATYEAIFTKLNAGMAEYVAGRIVDDKGRLE